MRRLAFISALLLSAPAAFAAGAPAGSTIANTAFLELNDGVTSTTLTSNVVNIDVQQVYSLTITPDGTTATPGQNVTVFPGQTGTLTYSLTNTGNGTDTFDVTAATANANAVGAQIQGVYRDTNGNGTYDAGTDTAVTSVNLAADASSTLFVRYTMPTSAPVNQAHQLNITGTSQGDATRTDTNNVGQLTTGRTLNLSLSSTQNLTVNAGQPLVFNDSLTNTGNSTLLSSEITSSVTRAATNSGTPITDTFTVSYSATGPGGTFTGTNFTTVLNQAIGAGLPAGSAVTYSATVTPATTAAAADQLTLTFNAFSPVANSATTSNQALTGDPEATIINQATVTRGVGNVTKRVAFCGATAVSCPDNTGGGTTTINAKPGEYVIYFLRASNTGNGNLFNIKLRDALPTDFVITNIGAISNQSGTILFSTNGSSWTNDAATLTSLTGGSSVLYVSVDTNADNTITAADTLSATRALHVSLTGYVRFNAVTSGPVTRDNSKLTTP